MPAGDENQAQDSFASDKTLPPDAAPLDAETTLPPEMTGDAADRTLGATFQDSSTDAGDSVVDVPPAKAPAAFEGTMQMPVDPGEEPLATGREGDSWHTQTAKVDTEDSSRTMLSDFGDFDDSSANPASQTRALDSQAHPGLSSDASATINIQSLDEQERKRVESALTTPGFLSKSGSGSGSVPFQLSRGMEGDMLLQPRHIGFVQNGQDTAADYRIAKVLGEGGMGTVFLAEQMSLDRLVALKVIKPLPAADRAKLESSKRLASAEKQRRDQFLSEALVTGALDHPNIVPIHDVGRSDDGSPFYSMKRVEGTSWRSAIQKNSLDENLEILLKVADAVGFAHARGVIHRDIKPENVMLGEFGVVMLMDWGLALVTPQFPKFNILRQTSGFGGSPAYMAPEMTGRVDDLSASADIYLLGATLFEIITGKPPHPKPGGELTGWASVRQYLDEVVKANVISPPAPEHQGELMDIAMKAMATNPKDRYATAQEFQSAIRGYRSHAESIALAQRANVDLDKATQSKEYADYARSLFGFEEALQMWDGNIAAQAGLFVTRQSYAEAALEKQDFDLGLSLLDPNDSQHQPLIERLRAGQDERASRARRLKVAYRTTMALSILLVGGGLYSVKLMRDAATAQEEAVVAKKDANEAKEEAAVAVKEKDAAKVEAAKTVAAADQKVSEANREVAAAEVRATDLQKKATAAQEEARQADEAKAAALVAATSAKDDAQRAQELANRERKAADDASRLARSEEYVSQIGLARTRIEQNEYEDARRILEAIRQRAPAGKSMDWEWRWLWRQCHQSLGDVPLAAAGADVTADDRGLAFVPLIGGGAQALSIDGMSLRSDGLIAAPVSGVRGGLSAISQDKSLIAVAGDDAVIRLFDGPTRAPRGELIGHQPGAEIRRLIFLADGRLLSSSDDQTVRLWDPESVRELAVGWHIAPVRDVAAVSTPTGLRLVTAVRDLRGGSVLVWEWSPQSGSRMQMKGEFREHGGPVTAVAISKDGQQVASGDLRGRVLLWAPDQVSRADTRDALRRAVQKMRRPDAASPGDSTSQLIARELHDVRKIPGLSLSAAGSERPAHTDEVTRLEFSDDGQSLLSTSSDYSVKIWNVADGRLRRTLLGHGGGVSSAAFAGPAAEAVISTGADRTARLWTTASGDLTPEYRAEPESRLQAHFDEIWSATFDPTGRRILTAGRDHSARILEFDPATSRFRNLGELVEEIPTGETPERALVEGARWVAFSMAVRRDAKRLYIADTEGYVRIWDMTRAVEIASIPKTGRNFALALSATGRLLVTGSEDAAVAARLWTLDENGVPAAGVAPTNLIGPTGMLSAVAISPDSKTVFTGTLKQTNGTGVLWDAGTGKELATVPRLRARINAAAFSPDGDRLYVASDDSAVIEYSLSRKEIVRTFPLSGYVTDLSLSEDGRRLLTVSMLDSAAGAKSRLTLWTIPEADGEPTSVVLAEASFQKKEAPTADDEVLSARFIPGSQAAVSVHRSHDRRVSQARLWNLSDSSKATVERTLRIPTTIPAADLALAVRDPATNAVKLLSLHLDSVFQWNLRSLTHELSFRQAAAITEASYSSDARWIATGSRSVVLWDAETRKSIGKLEYPHEGPVLTVRWDPKEAVRFATGGADGKAKVWRLKEGGVQPQPDLVLDAGSPVRRIRWSQDGRLLAMCDDGKARIWDLASPQAAPRVLDSGQSSPLLSGTFTPRGDAVLAGSETGVAYVWRLNDQQQTVLPWAQLRGHADAVEDVGVMQNAGDPDGELRYLTASRDKSARLWSIQDVSNLSKDEPVRVREVLALRKHDLGVTAVQASADGRTLMTAGLDGRVILWPTGDAP